MPIPNPESYFDWDDPGHRMPPGVVRKCLLFAARHDPSVTKLVEDITSTPPGTMFGLQEEIVGRVAEKYIMPEELVRVAIEDGVRYRQLELLRRQSSYGEA